jgi:hypothetical protein
MNIVKLGRIMLYVFALGYAGFGVLLLISPDTITTLVGIVLPTPVARMEIRGVYGGQFLGTALMLAAFARHEQWFRPGMVAMGVICGGLVIGRTLGLILDGAANPLIYALYASEIAGLIIAVLALRHYGAPHGA